MAGSKSALPKRREVHVCMHACQVLCAYNEQHPAKNFLVGLECSIVLAKFQAGRVSPIPESGRLFDRGHMSILVCYAVT
jgi:hypothetical protein